jgi:hypothetical protein
MITLASIFATHVREAPAPTSVLRNKLKQAPPGPSWTELLARAVSAVERCRDMCEDEAKHAALSQMADRLGAMS